MSKANETSQLKDLTKYRLDEINNIKEYFNAEIKERKDIIKKNYNKIIALGRSKLNIIENLISQALINFEITHEEFPKIIYEKNNYEQIIDNIRNVKSINDLNNLNKQVL